MSENVRPVSGWKRIWWFPIMERRRIGWFLSTAPNVPVDVNSFWWEYRWPSQAQSKDKAE
jgi:hypothetical protein